MTTPTPTPESAPAPTPGAAAPPRPPATTSRSPTPSPAPTGTPPRRILLLRGCRDCGLAHHYPREFCPHCWSEDVEWERASGRATLYTWSVVHRNDLPPFGTRVPYVAAVVDLAEGPRMMTEIVECEESALAIGMELRVTFRLEEGARRWRCSGPERAASAARGNVFRGVARAGRCRRTVQRDNSLRCLRRSQRFG